MMKARSDFNSRKESHVSSHGPYGWASYGVFCVSYSKKNDRDDRKITAM